MGLTSLPPEYAGRGWLYLWELLDQLLGRMLEKGKALAAAPAPEKEVRP